MKESCKEQMDSNLFTVKTVEELEELMKVNGKYEFFHKMHGGNNPLMHHCVQGNIDIVCALLQKDFVMDTIAHTDRHSRNALVLACYHGHSELVHRMLTNPIICDKINVPHSHFTPLIVACHFGYTDVFDVLMKFGADPNLANIECVTPLMAAVNNKHIDIVDRLLQYDINIEHQDKYGRTVLHLCLDVNIFHRLYIYGANCNHQDENGNTPLHLIIGYGNVECLVSAIIDAGANLTLVNKKGYTAKQIAKLQNRQNIVELFPPF